MLLTFRRYSCLRLQDVGNVPDIPEVQLSPSSECGQCSWRFGGTAVYLQKVGNVPDVSEVHLFPSSGCGQCSWRFGGTTLSVFRMWAMFLTFRRYSRLRLQDVGNVPDVSEVQLSKSSECGKCSWRFGGTAVSVFRMWAMFLTFRTYSCLLLQNMGNVLILDVS
jgi:hypothetical protein